MRYASNILRLSSVGLVLAAGLAMASTAAANTPTEAANKKVVLDFYAALNAADASNSTKERIPAIAEKYLSPDYKQHTLFLPGPGTDREKLIRMFQSRPAAPPAGGTAMPRQRTDAVMAEGDKVMLLTSRDMRDPVTGEVKPSYIFNMFRVKDGKLVEHWDVSAGMGPPPGGLAAPGTPGAPGGPGAPGAPPGR